MADFGEIQQIEEIDVHELARRRAEGSIALVDVRQPAEFASGHVPGARLIPLDTLPDRLDELPASGEVLLICAMGGRSRTACEYLASRGVSVVNVAGGTLKWIEAGYDVDQGDDGP